MNNPKTNQRSQTLANASAPTLMRAIGYQSNLPVSAPDALIDFESEIPNPSPRDLLVRVLAVSVNPVDTKLRKSSPHAGGTPRVLGWDAAGIVEAVGEQVSQFQVGDAVYYAGDLTRSGSNSEYQLVDERLVALKPSNLSFAEAASLPLTTLTAYEALYEQLRVRAGQTILVIGGSGGVGSIATQLAKLAGLRVVVTASRKETVEWARRMGADFVLNHHEPLRPQLEAIGINEVDSILNTADTAGYWEQMADLIRPFGRITSIVESATPVDLTLLMKKSATFSWELMFTRSLFQTEDMAEQGQILTRVSKWIEEKKLVPTLTQVPGVISAANIRAAHAVLESGKGIGKIVLSGW